MSNFTVLKVKTQIYVKGVPAVAKFNISGAGVSAATVDKNIIRLDIWSAASIGMSILLFKQLRSRIRLEEYQNARSSPLEIFASRQGSSLPRT
jgi:hypothetical protein